MMRLPSAFLLAGMMTAASVGTAVAAKDTDRYAWLEDVTGDKPLSWVKEQNAKSETRLAQPPGLQADGDQHPRGARLGRQDSRRAEDR